MSRSFAVAIYVFVAAGLVLGTGVLRADGPRAERRSVEHVLVFEGIESASDLDLWLIPTDGEGTAKRLESDRRFRFVSEAPLRVAALPRGESLVEGSDSGILSRRLLRPDLSAGASSLVARRETRVRIFGVNDGVVHLRVVGYREFDSEGIQLNGRLGATRLGDRDFLGLGIAGVLLFLGITVARRRPERLA